MPPVILLVAMAAGATGNGLAPRGNTGTPAMAPGGGMQPYGNVPGVVVHCRDGARRNCGSWGLHWCSATRRETGW